jgi:hypothetical protein
MLEIINFLSKYSIWIYLGLLILFLVGVRNLLETLSRKREIVFGLERELLQNRINRIVTIMSLIFLLIMGEFLLVTFLVPSLPSASQLSTQTVNPLLSPPLSSSNSSSETQSVTQSSLSSLPPSCVVGQVLISDPIPDQEISGEVTIMGTADVPNFGFYKYEYSPVGTDTWTTILAGRDPVIDGELGIWDTTELTSGDYQLRLVVFDNINTEYPACAITLRVSN